jgi:four helix bundle protein
MKPSSYDDWLKNVPPEITADALWQMTLYRSAGSISANISEGYSRASKKDQARFYEYALGSARETRDWYYKGRHVLGEEITMRRLKLLVHVIRQLLKLVPETRGRSIREGLAHYETHPIEPLLAAIPIPET